MTFANPLDFGSQAIHSGGQSLHNEVVKALEVETAGRLSGDDNLRETIAREILVRLKADSVLTEQVILVDRRVVALTKRLESTRVIAILLTGYVIGTSITAVILEAIGVLP